MKRQGEGGGIGKSEESYGRTSEVSAFFKQPLYIYCGKRPFFYVFLIAPVILDVLNAL